MNRFFTFLMLMALSATIFSCGDDDKEEVKPVDPYTEAKNILVENIWYYTAVIIDGEKEETNACTRTIENHFKSDGTFEFIMDSDECAIQTTFEGTWSMPEAMDTFTITIDNSTNNYILVELTEEKLLLERPDTGSNADAGWQLEYTAQ